MVNIVSKDKSKCMYDYAEDYFKIEEAFEKSEGRKMTDDERLFLFAILSQEGGLYEIC